MPRAKKAKPKPNSTIVIEHDGEEVIFEVWDNPADEGTRGAHMLKKRSLVFDAVLTQCEEALADASNIRSSHMKRLIFGPLPLAEFGRFVMSTAKIHKLIIGKTLAEDVAQSIRIHYLAVQAALAKKKC